MSIESQPKLPNKIYAEAVVRSASGVSLLRSPNPITAQNVTQFYAQPSLLNLAADRLQQAGFEVLDIGKTSINIAADPDTYERSFKTQLEAIERPVIKEIGLRTTATYINSIDEKPFGEIDLAETGWDRLLDGIAINEPVYYHFRANLPSASPPVTTETYLSVPEGVAEGLNAISAHQQGITGKGVKVVMVDSGWYPHPFFVQHHYKVNVVLAPGLDPTNTLQDDLGHGTGESANLFAIAPEAELMIIKADFKLSGKTKNVNANAALQTAIDLNPNIISCSWGSNQRYPTLSPYNKLLAATVAEAVSKNIVVIFAAGNGHRGFPAQHPEVIAAGGVYLHLSGSLRGKLEASNYASGFISEILEYEGRRVPDVCGLVGRLPYGSYILLPVPPKSIIDITFASTVKDETGIADGWAAFSGTSAAAPQLAGVCALMKQVKPDLSPNEAKRILQRTARDVVEGSSNSSIIQFGKVACARAGPDLATGYGLANADAAVQAVASARTSQGKNKSSTTKLLSLNSFSLKELRDPSASPYHPKSKGQKAMNPDYSKLKQNLDEILWEFEKILERYEVKELELSINESNFVQRTLKSKTVYSLRDALDQCFPLGQKTIDKRHILAAKSLLKLSKYQETARKVITEVITNPKYDVSVGSSAGDLYLQELREMAFEALGEISDSDELAPSETDFFCGACDPITHTMTCTDPRTMQTYTIPC